MTELQVIAAIAVVFEFATTIGLIVLLTWQVRRGRGGKFLLVYMLASMIDVMIDVYDLIMFTAGERSQPSQLNVVLLFVIAMWSALLLLAYAVNHIGANKQWRMRAFMTFGAIVMAVTNILLLARPTALIANYHSLSYTETGQPYLVFTPLTIALEVPILLTLVGVSFLFWRNNSHRLSVLAPLLLLLNYVLATFFPFYGQYSIHLFSFGITSICFVYASLDENFFKPLETSNLQLTRSENALRQERALLEQRVAERTADLAAACDQLESASQMKSEFLASVSHELRTPLVSIILTAELLAMEMYGPLSDTQSKKIRLIESSGEHLKEMINDLLDLSRMESGNFQLKPESINIADICHSVIESVRPIAEQKNLELLLAIESGDVEMVADPKRIRQILINLLYNSVKFTHSGGRVGLSLDCDPEEGVVHLTVWDTGIGISEERLPLIFEPFVQVDGRLERQYDGVGLGLSLVRRLTDMHHGRVAVISVVEQGSRFTVTLPITAANDLMSDSADASLNLPASYASTPNILLVEDNRTNSLLICDYLQSLQCQVTAAENGLQAVKLAQQLKPDLIFMDIQMPVCNGIEATERIREMPALQDTPIIALTGLALASERQRCLDAGMNDYMTKPVSTAKLKAMLSTWLQPKPQ